VNWRFWRRKPKPKIVYLDYQAIVEAMEQAAMAAYKKEVERQWANQYPDEGVEIWVRLTMDANDIDLNVPGFEIRYLRTPYETGEEA